jgi:hypothetical protein
VAGSRLTINERQSLQMVGHEGWRLAIQTWRRAATSWRFCSSACKPFFVCQPEPAQHPLDSGTVHGDVVGSVQFDHQFVERDLALFGDTRLEPIGYAGELVMSPTIALPPRPQQPSLAPQLHQIVNEFGRHSKVPRHLAMPVAFIHIRDTPRLKLHWMWLAHQTPHTCLSKREAHHRQAGNPEARCPQYALEACGDSQGSVDVLTLQMDCTVLTVRRRMIWNRRLGVGLEGSGSVG